VHGPAIELNTDGENEIRQSGENKAGDLPGLFAGNLRVIAEDDASALCSLSVSFVFCCLRPILVRERLTSGLGFNQKT